MVKKVKEKIVEYFKVIKKGKEKLVKKEKTETHEEKPSKKQIGEENKILKKLFIGLGVLILVILGSYLVIYNANNFEYKGIKFDIMQVGEVVIYHTSFPAVLDNRQVNYNVYLKRDPRELEKTIPFQGNIYFPEIFVLDTDDSLDCEGDGNLAIMNLQQVLNVFGTEFITDENATCDPQGRYGHMKIQTGNLSAVSQFLGPACYILQVNDCEILEVTERYLVESLVKKIGEE